MLFPGVMAAHSDWRGGELVFFSIYYAIIQRTRYIELLTSISSV